MRRLCMQIKSNWSWERNGALEERNLIFQQKNDEFQNKRLEWERNNELDFREIKRKLNAFKFACASAEPSRALEWWWGAEVISCRQIGPRVLSCIPVSEFKSTWEVEVRNTIAQQGWNLKFNIVKCFIISCLVKILILKFLFCEPWKGHEWF